MQGVIAPVSSAIATIKNQIDETSSNAKKPVASMLNDYIKPITSETIKLLPDSLLVGSGLLSILTFSSYYLLFFFTIAELCIIQNVIASLLMSFNPEAFKQINKGLECSTGYTAPTLHEFSLVSLITNNSRIPDPLLFILSSASFYIYAMYFYFNDNFLNLGPVMMGRVYASLITTALSIIVIIIWRLYSDKCASIFDLTASVLFGLIGFAIFYQNLQFFGEDTVNLFGVPLTAPVTNLCVA